MYAPSSGGRQGVLFAVCQNKEMNEGLGRIKRAHSRPRMADATHYVSKEERSIAEMPLLQMPSMMPLQSLLSSPLRISYFSKEDCALAAENMMLVADANGVGVLLLGRVGQLLMILMDRMS